MSQHSMSYTPPPHMDAKALIERAARLLHEWHRKYGEHQPEWLPPAGDVRWLEEAAAYVAAHTLPQPVVAVGDSARGALQAPQPTAAAGVEPVAWMYNYVNPFSGEREEHATRHKPKDYELQPGDTVRPLVYAAAQPVAREPLTEGAIAREGLRILDLMHKEGGLSDENLSRLNHARSRLASAFRREGDVYAAPTPATDVLIADLQHRAAWWRSPSTQRLMKLSDAAEDFARELDHAVAALQEASVARMLTQDEVYPNWLHDMERKPGPDVPPWYRFAEAVIHNFCEVNGIHLVNEKESGHG